MRPAWTLRWLTQLALPFGAHYPPSGPGHIEYLHDLATGSWAWLRPVPGGGHIVGQCGPVPVWDLIEDTIDQWHDAGSPSQVEFTLTIHGQRQMVSHPEISTTWELPDPPRSPSRAGC
jgi:hypothetical protein